ncbi:MAG: hypothetical protein QXZ20_02980 [Candidatus Aenigmatarchaeota archaeon]
MSKFFELTYNFFIEIFSCLLKKLTKFNFINSYLVLSIFIHIGIFSFFSLDIRSKGIPVFFFWPDIIDRNYLLGIEQKNPIPNTFFSKIYFDKIKFCEIYFLSEKTKAEFIAQTKLYPSFLLGELIVKEPILIYLYDKPQISIFENKEKLSYRACVSKYGKVIFSYPYKLPINSRRGIFFQKYLRESALFLKDKYFWTKLEDLVK